MSRMTFYTAGGEEPEISDGLRLLTERIAQVGGSISGGMLGGEFGYGGYWAVPGTWGMHPYCWCEQDDCPWCTSCTCPEEAIIYEVDGQPVDFEFWVRTDASKWAVRRVESLTCAWCRGDRLQAPNFWHEPSGSWISWYKYIGRDMDIHLNAPWADILADCLASVEAGTGEVSAPAGLGAITREL